MNRKQIVLTAASLAVLWGGPSAYGYWVDRVDAGCNISFAFPVHIQAVLPSEAETAAADVLHVPGNGVAAESAAQESEGAGDIPAVMAEDSRKEDLETYGSEDEKGVGENGAEEEKNVVGSGTAEKENGVESSTAEEKSDVESGTAEEKSGEESGTAEKKSVEESDAAGEKGVVESGAKEEKSSVEDGAAESAGIGEESK